MSIHEEAEKLKKQLEEEQSNKVKIALFGQPGAGKSSLINKLVGSDVASSSPKTDETREAQVIEWNGIVLVDLPGYGTSKFPKNKFFGEFKVNDYDLYLCVFSGKFSSADTEFFSELKKNNKVCLFVRNKRDDMWQDGKKDEELEYFVIEDVATQIGSPQKIYFTSCRTGSGLDELSIAIFNNLDSAKSYRWARDAKALSIDLLNKKRAACENEVKLYAGIAAANAINPIPGASVAVDFSAVLTMFNRISECYGVNKGALSFVSFAAPQMLEAVKEVVNYATKRGITLLLERFATQEALKEVSKYIPFVGPVIAASIGFAITYSTGVYYMNECHKIAEAIINAELNSRQKSYV